MSETACEYRGDVAGMLGWAGRYAYSLGVDLYDDGEPGEVREWRASVCWAGEGGEELYHQGPGGATPAEALARLWAQMTRGEGGAA